MAGLRFVELRVITASEAYSNDQRRCGFLSSPGGCRWKTTIPPRVARLRELHDKLYSDDDFDSADRPSILRQIAENCLCDVHNTNKNLAAAANQWENEIEPETRPALPLTPNPKTNRGHKQIQFKCSPVTKKRSEDPKKVDARVRHVLADSIEIQDKTATHLYVFSYEGAPGLYKVGVTNNPDRRSEEHEKCYPGHTGHYSASCPNARLFERVIHAELTQYQRCHTCTRCRTKPKQHVEWFEAPLDLIRKVVLAWSLYALGLYDNGLSLDANHQRLPLRGFSDRPDRWHRWALGEAQRWMDENPSPAPSLPKIPRAKKLEEARAEDVSDSDAESGRDSTFSSPATSVDTPGTTPGITPIPSPGAWPDADDDYTPSSPTPAEKYAKGKSAKRVDEIEADDEIDSVLARTESVARALDFQRQQKPPSLPSEESKSRGPETPKRSADNSAAPSPADSNADASPITKTPPNDSSNRAVPQALLNPPRDISKGTIILVRLHADHGPYKIFFRGPNSPTSRKDCYSKLDPYCRIQCTSTRRVQQLVLAEFAGRTSNIYCPGCKKIHKDWIDASVEVIEASIRAWTEFAREDFDCTIPVGGLSQDADRWTKWAQGIVAKARGRNEPVESQDTGPPGDQQRSEVAETSAEEPRHISRTETSASHKSISKIGRRGSQVVQAMVRRASNKLSDPDSKSWFGRLFGQ
ncbi:hypothetical protein BJY01DRAFT_254817 [Aspergillus pseudoustus]|uniref:Bacteriophage T5 Orf172 DNA-binding domain-containing protein n=1 Tax=Aspergillus pseudoustus TaxID=1810923 RepID=A0ABR4IQ60_9EURO